MAAESASGLGEGSREAGLTTTEQSGVGKEMSGASEPGGVLPGAPNEEFMAARALERDGGYGGDS